MRLTAVRSFVPPILLAALALALASCDSTGPEPQATNVSLSPAHLSFNGTTQATFQVTANGRWSLASDSSWLRTDRASGSSGTTTVTVTVDRSGLPPSNYGGRLTISGDDELASVIVSMRFPTLTGVVTNTEDLIRPAATGDAAKAGTSTDEAIPGEYIVLLDEGMASVLEAGAGAAPLRSAEPSMTTLQVMGASLAADLGLATDGVMSRALPYMVVRGASERDAALLAADGRVRSVSPNVQIYAPQVTAAPADVHHTFGYQWHYDDIRLSSAWNVTMGDEDVVVAVIDTGFAYWHPDLFPNYLGGYDFAYGLSTPDAQSELCGLHGTHVAGTVAGAVSELPPNTSGVAPGVKLRLYRTGREEASCPMPLDAVIAAVLHAAGEEVGGVPAIEPVDAINLSLGTYAYNEAFEEAIALAIDKGVVVVAAAGNDGTTPLLYPAAFPGVIGVGATNSLEQRAIYSNYGDDVDVVAPGGDRTVDYNDDGYPDGVLSLYWDYLAGLPGYVFLQGTSMAAPHVAGVAALVRSVNPSASPLAVELILESTAKDLGLPGFDPSYGWGLVDAGASVALARAVEIAPSFSDVVVRLRKGSTIVRQVRAGASGLFNLGQVEEGTYTLEAGTDLDGDGSIDDFGEFHASTTVTIGYDGDHLAHLDVQLGLR